MNCKYLKIFSASLVVGCLLVSCEKEATGRNYEPVEIEFYDIDPLTEGIQYFDTIPTSSLPYGPLAKLTGDKIYDSKLVTEATPKVVAKPEAGYGELDGSKEKYEKYLVDKALFDESMELLKVRDKGCIRLFWQEIAKVDPVNQSNLYVEVTYHDLVQKKAMLRNATSDPSGKGYIIIPGTLRSYSFNVDGSPMENPSYYKFTLQPVSKSSKRGAPKVMDGVYSSYVKKTSVVDNEESIKLTEKNTWLVDKNGNRNYKHGDQDVFERLYDGNVETHFHTDYTKDGEALFPYSIVVDAGKKCAAFSFEYVNRFSQSTGLKTITLYCSNDDEKVDQEIGKLTKDDDKLPVAEKTSFKSLGFLTSPEESQYFKFTVTEGDKGKYFALAELRVFSATTRTINPEEVEEDRY